MRKSRKLSGSVLFDYARYTPFPGIMKIVKFIIFKYEFKLKLIIFLSF